MKIGVSLGSFINSTFEGAIKFCLKLSEEYNLNAVEIRLERENCRASIWPWEITTELKKFLENFDIVGVHLPFVYINPISQNPYIRELSLEQLKIAIEGAYKLNASYCVAHARSFNYSIEQKALLEKWKEVFTDLVRYADNNSIPLALENADDFHDLGLLACFVKAFDSNWLKIALDIGHAHIRRVAPLSSYPIRDLALRFLDVILPVFLFKKNMPYESYGSLRNFIKREKDLIKVIHVHDYNGRNDHIPIGDGKIDFSCLSELRSSNKVCILEIDFKREQDFRNSYERFLRLIKNKKFKGGV